jgi:hypothetical protein
VVAQEVELGFKLMEEGQTVLQVTFWIGRFISCSSGSSPETGQIYGIT